ncbi:MAG TPA: hypothetical protein VGC99_22140 [Candidatus Tectomicrobia bacterium]
MASETELRREVVNAELPIVPFSAPGYKERRGQAELALASNCLLRVGEIGILCRRNQELTQWAVCVAKHCPDVKIPTDTKRRNRLHKRVAFVLLQDPEFWARHEQFRTKLALAMELVEEAIGRNVPFGVVVFDTWSLAEELVRVLARRRKDWISPKKTAGWKRPAFTCGMPMVGC